MNEIKRILLSSTFDLKEEREQAMLAIIKRGHLPINLEWKVSEDLEITRLIENELKQVDMVLIIIGSRYGSIDKKTGISYTEYEYDLAKKYSIPRVVIVLDDNYLSERNGQDSGYQLIEPESYAFRIKILQRGRFVNFVSSLSQIGRVVEQALNSL